ncbi:MAG TPA: 23S rRNA (adenine(2503)-C(2))-methyltransferase RlmN [Chloroflexota bacterium]|nr:23S rRNA (adenine(2503)-C(2))-methyltransferase RlmN [Chloroflexota bacterium]
MTSDGQLPLALDLLPAEWAAVMADLGQPAYRARQVFHALHVEGAREWDAVRTLPAALRARLAERYALAPSVVVRRAQSRDGTAKYLLGLRDGREIETVHIPDEGRVTVCVSSQAGCALACAFCATGRLGLLRNLSAGEIVDQVEQAGEGHAAPNVVFMGMGEPLANYAAVVRAIRLLLAPEGLGLSPRRITLSTSGLPDRMRQLAREDLGIRLAVSLHAADDAKRTALMPINARYPIAQVLAAAREYAQRSGRRVSFEYVMLAGVNDTAADAARLAALLPRRIAHVNLIPYNPTDAAFQGSPPARIAAFAALLRERGVACSVRRSRGRDVQAACGQLAGDRGQGLGDSDSSSFPNPQPLPPIPHLVVVR